MGAGGSARVKEIERTPRSKSKRISLRHSEGDAPRVMNNTTDAVARLNDLRQRLEKDKSDLDYAVAVLSSLRKPQEIRPAIPRDASVDLATAKYVETFAHDNGDSTKGVQHRWSLKGAALGITFGFRVSSPRSVSQSHLPEDFYRLPPFSNGEVHSWGFNSFGLSDQTGGFPLQALVRFLFEYYGLVKEFAINRETLQEFISAVEDQYRANPYHNSTHAADVLQTVHIFLLSGLDEAFDSLEILSLLLSAAIHDVGHTGQNNAYHINAQTEFARVYNDKSVMENHHLSTGFSLLEKYNFLSSLSKQQYKTLRKSMIEAVLATDMATHFALVAEFEAAALQLGPMGVKRRVRVSREDQEGKSGTARTGAETGSIAENSCGASTVAKKAYDVANETTEKKPRENTHNAWIEEKHKTLLMKYCLHSADISNSAKPWNVCEPWADRVLEEFFEQGDLEKAKTLPVSPLCDRDNTVRGKSQAGFIDFIVRPTYEALAIALPAVGKVALPLLEENRRKWAGLGSEA